MKVLIAIPFTGLGLYNGFRGNRWLRNRIDIFLEFTLASLLAQTDRDFVVWFQWRHEEQGNKYVQELHDKLSEIPDFKFVFTYGGVCMYDDKYEDSVARERYVNALATSVPYLYDLLGNGEDIIQLLQPSDDCYDRNTVERLRRDFARFPEAQAMTFREGYLCNYNTKQVVEYNPKTNPPFAAIRFPSEVFYAVAKYIAYVGLKKDSGKYLKGTPLPSHEYLPECLTTYVLENRGFLVGTHGENISTHFNHPYGGAPVEGVLGEFGIAEVPPLKLPISVRKWLMRRLPYRVQRKLRYWFGERFWAHYYSWIRN